LVKRGPTTPMSREHDFQRCSIIAIGLATMR
jgi:hypothetical protein